jgi:tetratricopeptide (TPR) repeat protein
MPRSGRSRSIRGRLKGTAPLVLDPFNPLSQAIATFVCVSAGRIDEATRQQALAAELSPGYPPVVATLAMIREWQGHMDEAIDGYRKTTDMIGRLPHLLSYLANALANTGQRDEAERLLRELLALPAPPALDIARVYVGLREEDEAFAWLEKAVDQRVIHLLTITTDRRFDSVRDHRALRRSLRGWV